MNLTQDKEHTDIHNPTRLNKVQCSREILIFFKFSRISCQHKNCTISLACSCYSFLIFFDFHSSNSNSKKQEKQQRFLIACKSNNQHTNNSRLTYILSQSIPKGILGIPRWVAIDISVGTQDVTLSKPRYAPDKSLFTPTELSLELMPSPYGTGNPRL